ncbi:SCO4402 family protein [Salinispora arenicola]|uniref:SCO4402 family protein n=1 Tax=Salinispora arenicola TaxID=168697 RepID=UPI0004784833|nr:hypothetical protein [Salinispora arenicola]MCN0178240.1 hypothetical protein [Salinispora arenicola]
MEKLVVLESTMSEIRFPEMRHEIVRAVKALADPAYQWSAWIRRELPPGEYDEFTHRIHILYDDTQVLEDPDATIGAYLRSQKEANAMRCLAQAIDSLFDELGTDLSDEEYLRAPGWAAIVDAAGAALSTLRANG